MEIERKQLVVEETPENIERIDELAKELGKKQGKKLSRGEITRMALAQFVPGYVNSIPRRGEYKRSNDQ